MLGILAVQYLYNGTKHYDTERKNHSTAVAQVQTQDNIEDKIQVFFPNGFNFNEPIINPQTESPVDVKTKIASDYNGNDQNSPTPEEIAYVSAFKSYLDAHLKNKEFIFPKPEELNRSCQLPHAYYSTFTVNEKGIVQLKGGRIFPIPPCLPADESAWNSWVNSVDNYYNQLFRDMPRFVSPLEYKLAAPYTIDYIGIFNALTRDGNRIYWFGSEAEKLYQDFDSGKLKVIKPIPTHKN